MILLTIVAVEYFYRLPFAKNIADLNSTFSRSLATLKSPNVSDHWKEVVLLRYARDTLISTIRLASLLIGCLLLLSLMTLFIDWLLLPSPSVFELVSSMLGLLIMTISSLAYAVLRRSLGKFWL